VSAATLHRIHATLRAALTGAVRAGLISVNPGRYPELPRAARPRPQVWTPALTGRWQLEGWRPAVGVWTAAQTAQFLAQVRGHRLYALFHLVALRGPRRGEAAGLRWSDLDLDAGTLTVSGQLQQLGGRLVAGPPGRRRAAPGAGSSPWTRPPSPRCASTGPGSGPSGPPPGGPRPGTCSPP
jgi:integrase